MFIEITRICGDKVLVNIRQINRVEDYGEGGVHVYILPNSSIMVTETYKEIVRLIQEAVDF